MDKHTFWYLVTDVACFVVFVGLLAFLLVMFAIAILGGA